MDLPWPPGRPVGRSPKTYLRQGKGYGKESGNTTRRGSFGRHAPEKGKPPQGGGFRKWRRGRDLNPRYPLRYTPLAGARLRPARPPLQGVAHRAKALRGTFACARLRARPVRGRYGYVPTCRLVKAILPGRAAAPRRGPGARATAHPARGGEATAQGPPARAGGRRHSRPAEGAHALWGGRPVSGGPTRGRARPCRKHSRRGAAQPRAGKRPSAPGRSARAGQRRKNARPTSETRRMLRPRGVAAHIEERDSGDGGGSARGAAEPGLYTGAPFSLHDGRPQRGQRTRQPE